MAKLYEDLRVNGVPAEAHDLRINRGAVDAQLQWAGNHDAVQNKRPGRPRHRGELGQADVLLKRAKGIPFHNTMSLHS